MKWTRTRCAGLATAIAAIGLSGRAFAQAADLPRLVHENGRHALLVDGRPFLMLGAQVHNSSAWPAMLPLVWPAMKAMHVNTVEIPVYWEQFEPRPGEFDPSVVDVLLSQAREHDVRLVLLWFGTWKNGSNHYMPAWMKLAPDTYPNAQNAKGQFIDSPSAVVDATLQADCRAFAALMAHLKQADPQHTVIMVQVENEPGMWGSVRDHSPAADKLFAAPVPAEALAAMEKPAAAGGATWADAFGRDADEYFQVWCTARFIGQVAAAGKAVYPLPMYTNASLRNPLNPGYPPKYQVGGTNDNVIKLWQAAAPAIDVQAPDIYSRDQAHFEAYFDAFTKEGNPLMVPETGGQGPSTRFFYSALGHGAIGYAPFGMDDTRLPAPAPFTAPADAARGERYQPWAENYAPIAPMMREIAAWNYAGKLQAAVEDDQPKAAAAANPDANADGGEPVPDHVFHLGDWDVRAFFGWAFARTRPTTAPAGAGHLGRVLVVDLGPGRFLAVGQHVRLDVRPAGSKAGRPWQYLMVEEGRYDNGVFVVRRILNGDQTDWGITLDGGPNAVRVAVYDR